MEGSQAVCRNQLLWNPREALGALPGCLRWPQRQAGPHAAKAPVQNRTDTALPGGGDPRWMLVGTAGGHCIQQRLLNSLLSRRTDLTLVEFHDLPGHLTMSGTLRRLCLDSLTPQSARSVLERNTALVGSLPGAPALQPLSEAWMSRDQAADLQTHQPVRPEDGGSRMHSEL